MAGSTTNIGLKKPTYSEDADVAIINENMDALDSTISALDNGLAIVSNNNTHGAITAGQYVYVRNHGSLAEGMYTANSNIAANATLSSSNLTAVSSGSLNKLNSDINTLNSKLNNYAFKDPFNLTTSNQNNYTTPMVTTVYDQVNGMGWCTFIVAGKAEGSHLDQILIGKNDYAIRNNENGTWSPWVKVLNSKLAWTSKETIETLSYGTLYGIIATGLGLACLIWAGNGTAPSASTTITLPAKYTPSKSNFLVVVRNGDNMEVRTDGKVVLTLDATKTWSGATVTYPL